MEDFFVNIVGCGSATPSLRHNPACQVIEHHGRQFMIDCGEGAQLQMRRMKIKFSTIRHFFISHLHGDHFLGLPGLLGTMALLDIKGQVHVYMFAEGIAWLKEYIRISRHKAQLDIVFHPITREHALIYEDERLTVETFPLYHGVPCVGYIFREKAKQRKLRGDMLEFYNVPVYRRAELKSGADYITAEGEVIANERLTIDPDPSASYAYCSDTSFSHGVIDSVKGVSTIYHESTYADDKLDRARERGHSTARQAATVALEAGARRLIIGHYSKQYESEDLLLQQAREVFPDTIAANEGMRIPII